MSIIDAKGIKETIDPAILPRAAGGDIELTRERLAQGRKDRRPLGRHRIVRIARHFAGDMGLPVRALLKHDAVQVDERSWLA